MIDVVMLTNTADEGLFKMTLDALRSLDESEIAIDFNVILVESNGDFEQVAPTLRVPRRWNYLDYFPGITLLEYRGEKFNYNAALNQAFEHLSPDSTHVVISNNDVLFHKQWASVLTGFMSRYHLHVGSPFAPGWAPHEENFTDDWEVYLGTRTSFEVAGWCVCLRRDALEAIRPFDERFVFEWQDVDMVDRLIEAGYNRMGLVRQSYVTHLLNQSHHLIGDRTGMIEGAREIYLQKRNEQP